MMKLNNRVFNSLRLSTISTLVSSFLLLSACDSSSINIPETSTDIPEPPAATEPFFPDAIEYTAPAAVFPEGIEYDSTRNAFLVSSAAAGIIGSVDENGTYNLLVDPSVFEGHGTFGLTIDLTNNRLLAVSSNLQNPTVGFLYSFDLTTMEQLFKADLAVLNGGISFTNDVTVDANGNAYVTNSDQGIIYQVDLDGNASIWLQDERLSPSDPATETGANGIAYHTDGFLIVANTIANKLYKVTLAEMPEVSEIALPADNVIAPDGIEINDNQLVVVNNGSLGGFVSQFSMNEDWTSGTLTGDTFATGSIFPTTVTYTDDGFYVNNSYFNFPSYGNSPVDYLISRANFDQSQRYSGMANEIPRYNTSVSPLGYGTEYPAEFLADCTEELAAGVPDLRGDWVEMDVVINGEILPAMADNLYQERIEQCGERLIVVSSGVVHDLYKADGTMYNGVNDINPMGQPIHSTGQFTTTGLVLTGLFPTQLITLPIDVTRDLMTDDSGQEVLRFFNPGVGRVIYMGKQ